MAPPSETRDCSFRPASSADTGCPSMSAAADPAVAIDELVAIAPTIAKEIAVHLAVESRQDLPQRTVALANGDIAAGEQWTHIDGDMVQVPFARVVTAQRLISEDARRAYFHQISREFVFQHPIFAAAKVNVRS